MESSSIDLSITNIYRAWVDFRAGKKPSRAILEFESNLERNLFELQAELENGSYTHGGYDHKIISEKKRRDIYVASVRDRVVHRLLYNYLIPIIEPRLNYDVWSCRAGKGLQTCLERIQSLIVKYPQAWVWRTDIRKFFDNVCHARLRVILDPLIEDPVARGILHSVLDSYSSQLVGFGIPIGNLTSQILANIYLSEFDRFVYTDIKPLAYVRYGDDMVAFFIDKSEAQQNALTMRAQLYVALELSTRFEYIFQAKHGVHVLGHNIYASGAIMNSLGFHKHYNKLSRDNFPSRFALNLSSRQLDTLFGKVITRWNDS